VPHFGLRNMKMSQENFRDDVFENCGGTVSDVRLFRMCKVRNSQQ
jgi:hypothetical protein